MKLYYIGLDISNKETSICILDETGVIVAELISESHPKAIERAIRLTGCPVAAIGLETGCMSDWIAGGLKKCLHDDVTNGTCYWKVLCLDSFKVAKVLGMNVNKTDNNDAHMIAEIIRISCFSKKVNVEVYCRSPESREIRSLINIRQNNVGRRTSVYNEIRGILKSYGIMLPTAKPSVFCATVKEAIKGLSSFLCEAITSSLSIYEAIHKEIMRLTDVVEAIADKNKDVRLLTKLSGIGSQTALYFVATIEDRTRFKDPKDVGAYFGLTCSQYSSGDSKKQLGISKRGDKTMRSLLFEAATVLLYRTKVKSSLKTWGHQLEKKIGSKRARAAVARKLAVMMYEVFKTGKSFIEKPQAIECMASK